ncbi:RHS repeat domain-containing protein [Prosthecobacter sp.]|uniref:RHS repeat domain-containing protein n=1 Tax=Prosthecobacter sp. TaxID=1965333 RepID=UPI003784E28B
MPGIYYSYDARGRRSTKRVSVATGSGGFVLQQSLVFLYDGWNMIAEIDTTNGQLLRSYEWGLDLSGRMAGAGGVGGLLAVRFHGAATVANHLLAPGVHAPLYDGNGNATELVNLATGTVSARYEYGAFGETISVDGGAVAAANPFRFSTKYLDVETGLYNYGHRLYDALNARWLSRDPMEEEGGWNLYAMCDNDMLNQWDIQGYKGSGHHIVPWNLFNKNVSQVVQAFFDSDAARIFNDAYKFHDGSAISGISHDKYSEMVAAEFKKAFGDLEMKKLTIEQAQEFLGRLKSLPSNHAITMFNSGIQFQADEAAKLAAKGMKSKLIGKALRLSRDTLNRIAKAGGVVVKRAARSAKSVPIGRAVWIGFFAVGASKQGYANQLIDEARDMAVESVTTHGIGPLLRPFIEPHINQTFDTFKQRINATPSQSIVPVCDGKSGIIPEAIKFK